MKRQMFFATAFSAVLAVSAAAQTGSAPQTPSQDKAPQVTLTGCLTQGSGSAAGTSGTAGTSASPQFILTNATMGSGSPSSATGTSGAAAPSTAMGKSYKLMGPSTELKDNVNAKVEVKGTIEKASASPSGEPATSASEKDIQTLRVTSVRKIADTCSGQ